MREEALYQSTPYPLRTDPTTCIPSGVASPVTTNHAASESVFVNFINGDNLTIGARDVRAPAEAVSGQRMREMMRALQGYRGTSLIRNRTSP